MLFFMTYLIFFQFIFVLLTINMVFHSVNDGATQRELKIPFMHYSVFKIPFLYFKLVLQTSKLRTYLLLSQHQKDTSSHTYFCQVAR